MSHSTDDGDLNDDMKQSTLAKQFGCAVTLIAPGVVMKWGSRVRPSEPEAMRLVQEHAPSVPLPTIYASWFGFSRDVAIGKLFMSFVPGERLDFYWDSFTDSAKERICHDIWGLVAKIRTIPCPAGLQDKFCCAADGSPSLDPLLGAGNDPCPPIHDDTSLRNQIFARYVRHNGLSYADGKNLPCILPRSDKSVFTHGDVAPRNIMVDKSGQILGLLDWEMAGWYPEYWEYANIMSPSRDHD
ncbi:hypothetical protein EsDP_00006711 [Epichloe bromicola]|uniref:Aminoglycoside phosphotransferase domain-containing protein n=1 Tax=Epichloe bromicola TaxID=79588 RepID=A0ABQ0CYE1_9HYPO